MTPMSPVWGYLTGAIILFMMFTFIGIWIWAWRKHHHPAFQRMAQLPLEDETDANTQEDCP